MQSLFKQKGEKRGTVFGRDQNTIRHFSPEIKVKLSKHLTFKERLCHGNATFLLLGLFFTFYFTLGTRLQDIQINILEAILLCQWSWLLFKFNVFKKIIYTSIL